MHAAWEYQYLCTNRIPCLCFAYFFVFGEGGTLAEQNEQGAAKESCLSHVQTKGTKQHKAVRAPSNFFTTYDVAGKIVDAKVSYFKLYRASLCTFGRTPIIKVQ